MGLEVALWRAVAVYRGTSLGYAAALVAMNFGEYEHPLGGWTVLAVMALWTLYATYSFADPRRRGRPLLAADLAVAVGCLMATTWVETAGNISSGRSTLPASWVAAAVLSWAVAGGKRAGIAAALVLGVANILVHVLAGTPGSAGSVTFNGIVLLVMAGLVVGHVVKLALDAEARLARAVELEASTRERERLARGIHDSVLQVLAMVQRRGGEMGGEAAELGRLAGEQEAALRALIGTGAGDASRRHGSGAALRAAGNGRGAGFRPGGSGRGTGLRAGGRRGGGRRGRGRASASAATPDQGREPAPSGEVDLRPLLNGHASPTVTVSAPATPVRLPGHTAREVGAAVAAALDNVRRHCPDGTRAWVLLEDDGAGEVVVSVRDDGPGMPRERLAEAASAGRLGVAQSIRGRIRDLGGTVSIVSAPGQGTEIEMAVPAGPPRP
ncbi:MacS family sensor histidine kinase [Spirillospora sp. CA-255316]